MKFWCTPFSGCLHLRDYPTTVPQMNLQWAATKWVTLSSHCLIVLLQLPLLLLIQQQDHLAFFLKWQTGPRKGFQSDLIFSGTFVPWKWNLNDSWGVHRTHSLSGGRWEEDHTSNVWQNVENVEWRRAHCRTSLPSFFLAHWLDWSPQLCIRCFNTGWNFSILIFSMCYAISLQKWHVLITFCINRILWVGKLLLSNADDIIYLILLLVLIGTF